MQATNREHSETMKKHIGEMAHETAVLHAELANAEKSAAAATAATAPGPGYAVAYSITETGYGDTLLAHPYPKQQVHSGMDGNPQFGSGGVPKGPYDAARSNVYG